jgi:hypothetical protein
MIAAQTTERRHAFRSRLASEPCLGARVFPLLPEYRHPLVRLRQLVAADVPVQPAPPGAPFRVLIAGGGHGAWQAADDHTAAFTVTFLATDDNGTLLGILTLAGTATLGPGRQTIDAAFTVSFADPAGNVSSSGQGRFHGLRMVTGR